MRKIFFLVVLALFAAGSSIAELSPASQQKILDEVNKLAVPHGSKVGLAFIDVKSGWQFSVNGREQFPAASVAKLGVLAAAYHLADLGELDLDQKVVYRPGDKCGGAGVVQWMKPGKVFTLRHLLLYMIEVSDNTATKMAIEEIGLERINAYLKEIGLDQTAIVDPTMLNERPSPLINLTTPLNMGRLMSIINNGDHAFAAASAQEMHKYLKHQKYRWGIWPGVAPGTVVANKTGHVDKVLNDVGIVYTKQGVYVLAVFTRDFSQKSNARKFINNISQAIFENFTGTKLPPPKKVIKKKLPRRPSVKSRRR